MFNSILNYGIRILIIILGILFVFDVFGLSRGDVVMIRSLGVIMILFGIYRILSYRTAVSRYKNINQEEDEDDDEK